MSRIKSELRARQHKRGSLLPTLRGGTDSFTPISVSKSTKCRWDGISYLIIKSPSIADSVGSGGGSCLEMEGGSLDSQSSVGKKQNSLIASMASGAPF